MKNWSLDWKTFGLEVWSERERFWEEGETFFVKRDRVEMRENCADPIYRNPSFSIDQEVLRGVEN